MEFTIPDVSPPPIDELKKQIQTLESADLRCLSIDELKERLIPVFCGVRMAAPFIQVDRRVFRAVEWDDKPMHRCQLWCPPCDKISFLGRVNRQNQPMFYCSNSPAAAFLEVGAKPGKRYALSIWRTRARFLVNTVGYVEDIYTKYRDYEEVPDWVTTKDSKWCDERELLVRRFLHEQFTKRVLPGQEHLYKMSIAIAEKQFEQDLFEGLMYPTVAAAAKAENLAIKPTCAESRLQFVRAEYAVVKAIAEENVSLQVVDAANELSGEGTIQWLGGASPQWKLSKQGQQLLFSVEDGHCVARDALGNVIEPEMGPRAVTLTFSKQPDDNSSSPVPGTSLASDEGVSSAH